MADDPKVRSLDSVQSLVRSKQQDSDSNPSISTPTPNKLLSDLNGDLGVRDLTLQFGELVHQTEELDLVHLNPR